MNLMQAEPDSFLLTGTSHFIEPRILQNRIKKYSRECGIKDIHFHVLRHTFATRCVEVGFEIKPSHRPSLRLLIFSPFLDILSSL